MEVAFEQWVRWNEEGGYSLLPYVRKIKTGPDVLPAFWDRAWEEASPYASLLESGKGGRYSIVGLRPASVLVGDEAGARLLAETAKGAAWEEAARLEGSPLQVLREWMRPWRGPRPEGVPDCVGGVIGYWSYDVVRSLERLPVVAADDLGMPEYVFQRFEELWIADHEEGAVYIAVHARVGSGIEPSSLRKRYDGARERSADMERQWSGWLADGRGEASAARKRAMRERTERDLLQIDVESLPGLSTSMSKATYQEAVRSVQRYIGQGDVFQVNLSLRQSRPTEAAPETLYEWLRVVNPSPYMGMFRAPDFSLVSASPELLVKLDDGKLSTRPIAGTRRRGRTPEEDLALEDELLSSDKERAEHVMLVDLERNDLGRVSEYGTVKVPELMTVERYSHVMHLVSQVEGRIARGKDALDVLAAVFPGGTITGAPKIRTMEIIEELEPTRRGPYTGSVGWIDYSGNMEFNIIIRTIAVRDGVCHIQAGAGIVIDSEPEREFYESLNKAKALWKAVQYSEATEGQGNAHDSGHR
ncbi:anthranilate synthase component I family protein [Cohnella suwonensis]|uniref:Anthranilate synthase component I family protein n=1 Tax=Cohnella suwonensis TaxID=696072 RepID=A0ABW0LVF4_9BACL